jgi:hypothetical protein
MLRSEHRKLDWKNHNGKTSLNCKAGYTNKHGMHRTYLKRSIDGGSSRNLRILGPT